MNNMYVKYLIKKSVLTVKSYFSSGKVANVRSADGYNYKWQRLRKLIRAYNVNVLVETGTYYGLTVDKLHSKLDKLVSIEIDDKLFSANFRHYKNRANVDIIHGDSGIVLPSVLDQLRKSEKYPVILFWLDGHCSEKETGRGTDYSPLLSELKLIKECYVNFKTIVVIDDLRLFDGQDYPNLNELVEILDDSYFEWSNDSDACIFIDRRL